jgi:P-type Ca2+ transporter type 2C
VGKLIGDFHEAGIDTLMITGDQNATAGAVARQIGLNGDQPLGLIDSSELDQIDLDSLAAAADNIHVFSRVDPSQKLKIVKALQRAGKVVAMSGDGINDGPALRASDIGVVMGTSGTDGARVVGDVVLEGDRLDTMLIAIGQGRTIYINIRKSIHFLLATNLSEIEMTLAAVMFGAGLPLTPMQLLWINLLTDIFPSLALALEPPEADVLKRPPRDPKEAIIRPNDFARLGRESAVITGGALTSYGYALLRYGAGPRTSTQAFLTLVIAQLLHAQSCRSEHVRLFDSRQCPPNPYLNIALGGSLGLQLLTVLAPGLQRLLGTTPISLLDGLVIGAGAVVPLLINEWSKMPEHGRTGEKGDMDKAFNDALSPTHPPRASVCRTRQRKIKV